MKNTIPNNMEMHNIRLTGNFSRWILTNDHQGIKELKELHLEQILRTLYLH